jgi:hypothetical protein
MDWSIESLEEAKEARSILLLRGEADRILWRQQRMKKTSETDRIIRREKNLRLIGSSLSMERSERATRGRQSNCVSDRAEIARDEKGILYPIELI